MFLVYHFMDNIPNFLSIFINLSIIHNLLILLVSYIDFGFFLSSSIAIASNSHNPSLLPKFLPTSSDHNPPIPILSFFYVFLILSRIYFILVYLIIFHHFLSFLVSIIPSIIINLFLFFLYILFDLSICFNILCINYY